MSRVYFHSPSGEAELRGSERHWLDRVANGLAEAAWNVTTFERAAEVMSMVAERSGDGYLHRDLLAAQANPGDYEARKKLVNSLKLTLRVSGLDLLVAGHRLRTANIDLNTALVLGSDPVRLAAKISGWSEEHAWVDGPDRTWLADLIDEGLRTAIFRRGFWFATVPDGPKDTWSDQGWEAVQAHLRSNDVEPCVMSYSVTNGFPNSSIAAWEPPPMPDGWAPDWADDDQGRTEWESDYPTPGEKEARYLDDAHDLWYALPVDEQWRLAMDGLRTSRPWAQLTPDNLGTTTFHVGVTVYDLFAADRDDRVRAHFEEADVDG